MEGLLTNSSTSVPFIVDVIEDEKMLLFMLTETWLREHLDDEVSVKDYNIYRVDRSRQKKRRGRNSGGVAIYVKNSIVSLPEILLEHSCGVIEAICIKIPSMNLIICTVYRQPNDPVGGNVSMSPQFETLLQNLSAIIGDEPVPTPNILIAGDFNLPHTSWPACSPEVGAPVDERNMINLLSEFCSQHFLFQLINEPTHRAGNTLDLVLTNDPDLFPSFKLTPASPISSHSVITVQTMLQASPQPYCAPQDFTRFDQMNLLSDKTDWNSIRAILDAVNWHKLLENLSLTKMVEKFTEVCENAAFNNAPRRKRRNTKKKIPRDRRTLMRKRTKLRKQFSDSTSEMKKTRIRNSLIDIERKLQDSYKLQDQREEELAVKAISSNPKYFYSFVRRNKVHYPIGPLEDTDGHHVNDPTKMAQILSNQYKQAFSVPSQRVLDLNNTPDNNISDIDFTEDMICKAIDEVSVNAAPGPDRFPAALLKNCKEELSKPLYIIWRKSLDSGEIPSVFKISNITPVHKGGPRQIPKNYRPVALTSHLIKVFEKIIRNELVNFIERNDLMNPNQHGFRAGRSCLSQLLQHFDKITRLLEQGKNVDIIYLDFSKAFDKLDFKICLQKLHNMGITGRIYRWLGSFLTIRMQCVVVGGAKSHMEPVISGVPQGSVIGPLLYLIMMRDIDDGILSAHVSSFADSVGWNSESRRCRRSSDRFK